MEKSFSQRMGLKKVKNLIQINSMDDDLRNGLWNAFILHFKIKTKDNMFILLLRTEFFKLLIDVKTMSLHANPADLYLNEVGDLYFKLKWFEVYDFIEFVANN